MAGFRWIVFLFALCFSSFSSAAERIVLQLKWVNQFQFAGYYAAVEKGFYKTAGLDVEGRVALHAEIRKLRERGKTIILASHDMAEVEALADTVAILKDGRIAFCGTQDELSRTLGKRFNVTIKTAESETRHEVEDVAAALLDILADYRAKNLEVLDIRVNRGSLEQHFIELSGRKHS